MSGKSKDLMLGPEIRLEQHELFPICVTSPTAVMPDLTFSTPARMGSLGATPCRLGSFLEADEYSHICLQTRPVIENSGVVTTRDARPGAFHDHVPPDSGLTRFHTAGPAASFGVSPTVDAVIERVLRRFVYPSSEDAAPCGEVRGISSREDISPYGLSVRHTAPRGR